MDIIPHKQRVVGLVEQANEGKICLPNFQRDFVWTREQVADLLRSIMRRYFIGSLLLLQCDPARPPFAPIFLRGASSLYRKPQPDLLVLDGQQRLTALMYALTAPDLHLKDSSQRRWFFLDLSLLTENPDDDGIIFDRSPKDLDRLDQPEEQFARRILPCTRLLRPGDFLSWRDGLDDWLREREQDNHKRFRAEWRDKWTKAITDFQTFEVPLVLLPRVEESDTQGIGRVCAIFEKLNSTGVELSVYDLLTARLYRSGINLHDLWHKCCQEHKLLTEWSEGKAEVNKFGVLVLRTLALLRGLEAKASTLIDLKPSNFAKDWEHAANAMERALELLTLVAPDGFGVFQKKWFSNFALLPVLAALRAYIEDRGLGEGSRNDLRRWYWCNVFLERYSSGVESKSRKDYSEMLAYWVGNGPEPTVYAEARAQIGGKGYTVRDSASYASAVYSGMFSLLALRGARDWMRGEVIQLQNLHDHHIFPREYLKRHGILKRTEINNLANRTLISDETNRRIAAKAPADYLRSRDVFPRGSNDELLTPHFLGKSVVRHLSKATDDLSETDVTHIYEGFCRAREAAMIAEIRKVCGIAEE